MESTTTTQHTVLITEADFIGWLATNAGSLPLGNATIQPPSQGDGRVFNIIFPVDSTYLDTFLHTVILDLPAQGAYSVEVFANNPNAVGRISWTTES